MKYFRNRFSKNSIFTVAVAGASLIGLTAVALAQSPACIKAGQLLVTLLGYAMTGD